jgi:hypothetical protein
VAPGSAAGVVGKAAESVLLNEHMSLTGSPDAVGGESGAQGQLLASYGPNEPEADRAVGINSAAQEQLTTAEAAAKEAAAISSVGIHGLAADQMTSETFLPCEWSGEQQDILSVELGSHVVTSKYTLMQDIQP